MTCSIFLSSSPSSELGVLGVLAVKTLPIYFKVARNSTRSRSSTLLSFLWRSSGMAEAPRLRSSTSALGTSISLASTVISLRALSSSDLRTPVTTVPSFFATTTDSNPCAIAWLGATIDSRR